MRFKSFFSRLFRAARLDVSLYQEIVADNKANVQAFLVVVLVSLAISIGIGFIGWFTMAGAWSIWGILAVVIGSIIVWFFWTLFAYLIGTRIFRITGTTASMGAALRAVGFSSSPGVLGILAFIPVVGGIILLGVSVWSIAAGIIAVKHSFQFTTCRSITTWLVTWLACTLAILLTIIPLTSYLIDGACTYNNSFDSQLHSILSRHRFSIVKWELAAIPHELSQLFSDTVNDIDDAVDKVIDYFSNEGERNAELETTVEKILESQIKEILVKQDIFGFPPVNLKLGELPRLLVISPRDRITSIREIMLVHDISLEEIADIEVRVDELGVSSLVVDVGGFGGTYPSYVTNSSGLKATINTAVEEWVHQYLAFKPLGFRYVLDILGIARDYEIATINETVAGIVSKEVGAIIYEKYYYDTEQSTDDDSGEESGFDFNQEMREIRIAVDSFLARGEIELAEQYMEQKRQYLVSQGYYIRKLNQAYFAWHGTYADEPTSVSPIGTELRELRSRSASIKNFLDTVVHMTSRQDLKDAILSIH